MDLTVIEYPGIVKNIDNCIKSLGGSHSLCQALEDSTKASQLRLTLNSANLFSIPIKSSTQQKAQYVLCHVTQLRHKKTQRIKLTVQIVGIAHRIFHFNELADFQYNPITDAPLAATAENNTVGECVDKDKLIDNSTNDLSSMTTSRHHVFYDQLVPHRAIIGCDAANRMFRDATQPIYLPPLEFSCRSQVNHIEFGAYLNKETPMLTPQQQDLYHHRQHHHQQQQEQEELQKLQRGKNFRLDDFAFAFSPQQRQMQLLISQTLSEEQRALQSRLKALFEQRPVWTKVAIYAQFDGQKMNNHSFKKVRMTVSYSVRSGPFRRMCIRLGYDPRVEPLSAPFQAIDFRLKRSHLNILDVANNDATMNSNDNTNNANTTTTSTNTMRTMTTASGEIGLPRTPAPYLILSDGMVQCPPNTYLFSRAHLPHKSQMFYSLCDVRIEKVQRVLADEPVNEEYEPHQFGWFSKTFFDRVRACMMRFLDAIVEEIVNSRCASVPAQLVLGVDSVAEKSAETSTLELEMPTNRGDVPDSDRTQ